jgi:hypothetical protein
MFVSVTTKKYRCVIPFHNKHKYLRIKTRSIYDFNISIIVFLFF